MGIGETQKLKYAVRVSGTNCRAKVGSGSPMSGFFTTRFVEGRDEDEAARLAIDLIRRELVDYGLIGPEQCSLLVDEVWEDRSAFSKYAPGSGFTW